MVILLMSAGLVALVVGAELLVRGASRLAAIVGLSPLVVGLTVVAFGTSAPEFAVSISSAVSGQADLAVGNVVGSNIFNVLFILGLSALITPLVVDQKLVRFDVPLMIVASLLVLVVAWDRSIDRIEGGLMFGGLVAFTVYSIMAGRKESTRELTSDCQSMVTPSTTEPAGQEAAGGQSGFAQLLRQAALIAAGLALLVAGASWLVDSASELARRMGVSELVIGLTIVAGGTSLPEVATSVMAALRGERDIAVGNVVGSNLFNILGVLGATALLAPHGVTVAPQALAFDIPVMIAVAAACLPVFFTGHLIARWEGAVFLLYHAAYTTALVMISARHAALPAFQQLLFVFVVPLTVVTLLVCFVRELRQRTAAKVAT